MLNIAPLHARITPIDNTVPGIEYGSIDVISRTALPFGLIFCTTYATSVPRNIDIIPAETDKTREFLIESIVPLFANTF